MMTMLSEAPVQARQQPTYSPDGRFWWDGYQWIPLPPAPPVAQVHARSITADVVKALIIFAAIIGSIAFISFAYASGVQREAEAERQSRNAYCEGPWGGNC